MDKNKISRDEAEMRFKDLKLVPGVNLGNIDDVTPEWLTRYVEASEREISQLQKSCISEDAKRYEINIRGRIEHVQNLCRQIFESR